MSAEVRITREGALAGRRIVVTRARAQGGSLIEKLEALGAEVLLLPAIEIVPPASFAPLDAALLQLHAYDWLVVTSANAVRVLRERMRVLGIAAAGWGHVKCAAVGPATRAALEELGLRVTAMPEHYVAEALAETLRGRVNGKRVLLVRASVARDVVPEALRGKGARVEIVEAYRTVMPQGAGAAARALFTGGHVPDAVTFMSASAVTNVCRLLRDAGVARPPELKAISIGAVTTAALREQGWPEAAEAGISTEDGLVEACVRALG
ncbi:MAG: uroporphyrinogen-III synthase [Acidobacteriaceae bacterium]